MTVLAPADSSVIVLEDVWKRYPPEREPNALLRALARLGGVELEGVPVEDEDEDEQEQEVEPARGEGERLDAIRGVSLAIEPGACLGIVGPSGSGKSVLLRLIAGLAPPTEGRVTVYGTVAPALASVARLVPSRTGVRKTLLALAMMTRLPRGQVKRLLPEIFELAGLSESDLRLGTTLTPQQMRRVLLAMMLSVDADVVLIDVPLEPGRSRGRFVEKINERVRSGATVLIAAETPDEIAEITDDFIQLDEGRIAGDQEDSALTGAAGDPDPSAVTPEVPERDLPLSADAGRYFEFIRTLVGDRRANRARRIAIDNAAEDAERVEWVPIAQAAGFDWVQHLAVVERLRRAHGVTDEEPIARADEGRELPLSGDAARYLEYIALLAGEDRADQAHRNAVAFAPEHATRVEWSWIARWAGFAWTEHILVVERLRELHGVTDEEPIFGAAQLRRKRAGGQS